MNVSEPGMYQIDTRPTHTRMPQLPHTFKNTNPLVSTSIGVIHRTSVSRPQLRSTQLKEKVMQNNSQVKIKQKEVKDHHKISSFSNKTKSVTACNDILKFRTLNVNVVCVTCSKCVFNSNHDACVSKLINDVNARTKKPKALPSSARKPKRQANQSVATPHKITIEKQCPSGYKWILKTKKKWMPKIRTDNMSTSIRPTIDTESRITNDSTPTNDLGSNLSNDSSSSKSFADRTNHPAFRNPKKSRAFWESLQNLKKDSRCTKHMTRNLKLLCNFIKKTVWFGNDQFAPILGYEDFVQGNITIKRVYYVKGLNHNLFLVSQLCDADLEVAFHKSTCFVRDIHGNDLLKGNHGSDLYLISLQETSSPTPICFMEKASPTQAWLWHCRFSYLNSDTINLLSKKDIVNGLPKLNMSRINCVHLVNWVKQRELHSRQKLFQVLKDI
uniref:Uncharacterized protein n=1 Tax=Tanacetum cinerariifolium TaxID=118510 RepID=A0A699HX18_TANCI|nr:hypothetical protein [Tanacetum cinerariifolium]